MIKKWTDKHINKIPDSPSLYEMKNIALCGTACLLGRVLSMVTEKYHPKVSTSKFVRMLCLSVCLSLSIYTYIYFFHAYIYTHTHMLSVTVIAVQNRSDDLSSNPGRGFLHLTSRRWPLGKVWIHVLSSSCYGLVTGKTWVFCLCQITNLGDGKTLFQTELRLTNFYCVTTCSWLG